MEEDLPPTVVRLYCDLLDGGGGGEADSQTLGEGARGHPAWAGPGAE